MDAVAEGSKGRVSRDCIGLVTSRAAVGELLKLDHLIDLVIPRGSGALVNHIKVLSGLLSLVVLRWKATRCGAAAVAVYNANGRGGIWIGFFRGVILVLYDNSGLLFDGLWLWSPVLKENGGSPPLFCE